MAEKSRQEELTVQYNKKSMALRNKSYQRVANFLMNVDKSEDLIKSSKFEAL